MSKIPFYISLGFVFICVLFQQRTTQIDNPQPTEFLEDGEEDEDHAGGFQAYFELTRNAALGRDWEKITQQNFDNWSLYNTDNQAFARDSFGNGILEGKWLERGVSNISGNVSGIDYLAETDEVYGVSDAGLLFKGNLEANNWKPLNDQIRFNNNVVKALITKDGKTRILVARNKKINYSEDNGKTWMVAVGTTFTDNSYGPEKLVQLKNGTLYYFVRTNFGTTGSGYILFASYDDGANWITVKQFNGRDSRRVNIWNPFESNNLYINDLGQNLYRVDSANVTLVHAMTGCKTGAEMSFVGYQDSVKTKMYVLANSELMYMSEDTGATWKQISTIAPKAWSVGMFANPLLEDNIYYGEVNMYKSTNDGSTWGTQNGWGEYYGNNNKLHADIMRFGAFRKKNGDPFMMVANHGGVYLTENDFYSTLNISKQNLNNAQYYDFVMVSGALFGGTQDQGMHRLLNFGKDAIIGGKQVISGDYVRMNTSNNATRLWEEYPGGVFHYYNSPLTQNGTSAQIKLLATAKVNIQQWVVPSFPVANKAENTILTAGSLDAADVGAYLIRLTANTSAPFKITGYKYPYNFRTNAKSGNSYITALAQSTADSNYYYVAMADGSFFSSTDAAQTWTLNKSLTGISGFNYGSWISPSKLDGKKVFYCGSGGKVYLSTDAGTTFKNLGGNGLPSTFVSELDLNEDETILFAATDAGPYMYVFDKNKWYSLSNASTPVQLFTAVEYIPQDRIVRFATFGRGIWDLQLKDALVATQDIDNQLIKIYPSLVSANQNIHIQGDFEDASFQLYDLNGRLLFTKNINGNADIEMPAQRGLYLYQLKLKNGKRKVGKLVVE
jgi:photosystem II stability/assembly factor-like uncharacterized protein